MVRAGVSSANVARTIASIDEELRLVLADGFPRADIDDAKLYLTGSLPRQLETNAGIAGFLLSAELHRAGHRPRRRLPATDRRGRPRRHRAGGGAAARPGPGRGRRRRPAGGRRARDPPTAAARRVLRRRLHADPPRADASTAPAMPRSAPRTASPSTRRASRRPSPARCRSSTTTTIRSTTTGSSSATPPRSSSTWAARARR